MSILQKSQVKLLYDRANYQLPITNYQLVSSALRLLSGTENNGSVFKGN